MEVEFTPAGPISPRLLEHIIMNTISKALNFEQDWKASGHYSCNSSHRDNDGPSYHSAI